MNEPVVAENRMIEIGKCYHLRSSLFPDNHFEIRVTRVDGKRIIGVITNDYKDDVWHPTIGVSVFVYESEWDIHGEVFDGREMMTGNGT